MKAKIEYLKTGRSETRNVQEITSFPNEGRIILLGAEGEPWFFSQFFDSDAVKITVTDK